MPVVRQVDEEEPAMLRSIAASVRAYTGPYPSWGAPTPEACRLVTERLAEQHGLPSTRRRPASQPACVLDSLVRTLLSQNTTDTTSARAFDTLKLRFPSWDMVRTAPLQDVADAIRVGGLAEIKAGRVQAILSTLQEERGACSLEHLRGMHPAEAKALLLGFKGVGKKTVACVLLFALELPEFAVDTHVWEISKALGWVPTNASRDQAYDHLNELVPDELKYDLHVLLVSHGKQCPACAKAGSPKQRAAKPADGGVACPLADLKPLPSQLKTAYRAGPKHRTGGDMRPQSPPEVAKKRRKRKVQPKDSP